MMNSSNRLAPFIPLPGLLPCLLALLTVIAAGCATGTGKPNGIASPPPTPPPPPVVAATPAPVKAAPPAEALPAPLPPPEGEGWTTLFDGASLAGWTVTGFAGHGEVGVQNGLLTLDMGAMLTGVNGPTNLARSDYEITLDAMKVQGSDFFCGLTFPVANSCCSLIVGGWGGGVVGISSIDGGDASLNETTKFKEFQHKRWYRIRVRVTAAKIEAWIDKEKVVDLELGEKKITVRPGEIEANQPFGICTYQTSAALCNIQWRPVPAK